MSLLKDLWHDETAFVVSSELVMLGTLGVLGTTVGLNMVTTAVNEEFKDLAFGIRSMNQSYSVRGFASCGAFTAGSSYIQQPVPEALASLCANFQPRTVQGQAIVPAPVIDQTPVTPVIPAPSTPAESLAPVPE